MSQVIVGITPDVSETKCHVSPLYADRVREAGGLPIILPCRVDAIDQYLEICDAFVFSGGDDPVMEPFGHETHPKATRVHPVRQAFETALLERIGNTPALGICLGMQMMALLNDGSLDQHMPETTLTHADHWGKKEHVIEGILGCGTVLSNHRQAVSHAGALDVVALAHDGVIEAIRDAQRPFYVGVQWHAERTDTKELGVDLFQALIEASR